MHIKILGNNNEMLLVKLTQEGKIKIGGGIDGSGIHFWLERKFLTPGPKYTSNILVNLIQFSQLTKEVKISRKKQVSIIQIINGN